MIADYEHVFGAENLRKMIDEHKPDAVVFDSEGTDDACLLMMADILKEPDAPKAAVYLTSDSNLARFADAGISTFFNKLSLTEGIKQLQGDRDSKYAALIHKAVSRLRDLANCVEHGIVVLDADERISFVNEATKNILDMTGSELNRKTLNEIFSIHPYVDDMSRFDEQPHTTCKGKELLLSGTLTNIFENGVKNGSILIFYPLSLYAIDRQKELELLQYQERYHSTQQAAAFKKQMLVIKDEISGTKGSRFFFETYFKPLDIMSGDIYGNMNIKDGRYFLYIIDAMGKGLSASVTALQSSSFINHSVELSIIKNDFDMSKMLSSFLHYIRDRLMEDEALCAVFAMIDTNEETISVSSFGMPPILACMKDGTVEKLRTPNMPIMRFMAVKEITEFSLKDIDKLLIYSDGLSESSTKDGSLFYDRLPACFGRAATKKHLLKMVNEDIVQNDDDITFFFINAQPSAIIAQDKFTINSSASQLSVAGERISSFMETHGVDSVEISTFEFAVGEMLMNALEHGSLGLSFRQKQDMIRGGVYDDFISARTVEKSPEFVKEIEISCSIATTSAGKQKVLMIEICDSGSGFNVSEIFKLSSFDGNLFKIDAKKYNGRGIFITDNLVDGLYYSDKGNTVHLIKVLEQ
jgi:anti-sigma regulatory factor (Ser/Thr protein kinase)/PAS domain-containing protein